jgi:hypothetical protein
MPAFLKFNKFALNLGKKKYDFTADVFKVALTNTAPDAVNNEILTDITQITAANGYSAGGQTVPSPACTQTGGVATFVGDAVVFTASGGSIATFRYAVLYDSTTGFLIGYYDYGSTVTITTGNTFTVTFNSTATGGTVLTVTVT